MRALTWHGRRDVRVDTVPDPVIEQPDDVVVQITSSGLCGSDLHLYEVLTPFLTPATSSATSRWVSWRRWDRPSPSSRSVTAS